MSGNREKLMRLSGGPARCSTPTRRRVGGFLAPAAPGTSLYLSKIVRLFWLFAGLASASVGSAYGQSLPGTVQPGAVERSLQQTLPEPAPDRVIIPAQRGLAVPSGADSVRVRLQKLDIKGATALDAQTLRPTYAGYVGKDITLADLYKIASAITDLYTAHGYALSFAMVPAQQIDKAKGEVQIDVIEGYIQSTRYSGGVPAVVPAYGDTVTQSKPLRTDDVERAMLLANDLPGITAHGVFERDETLPPGATTLAVVVDRDPITANVTFDNRGTEAFGPWRTLTTVGLNSLLGQGESVSLTGLKALNGNALNYGAVKASLPVGGQGWVLSAGATYTDARPATPVLTSAGFASSGWTFQASASNPVLRGRDESLWLWGGAEAELLRSDLASSPNSRDYIYGLQAGAIWNRRDSSGVTAADLTLTQGMPVFGATTDQSALRSRMSGSGTFTSLSASITRLQVIGGGFSLYLAGSGQFASRGLLSPSQCGYGGGDIGRGFDSNEIVGDQCVEGLAELRYDVPLDNPVISRLQPFVSYDAGAVWNDGPVLPGTYGSAGANSVDIGFRTNVLNRFDISFDYGLPIGRDIALEGNRGGRFFVLLGARL